MKQSTIKLQDFPSPRHCPINSPPILQNSKQSTATNTNKTGSTKNQKRSLEQAEDNHVHYKTPSQSRATTCRFLHIKRAKKQLFLNEYRARVVGRKAIERPTGTERNSKQCNLKFRTHRCCMYNALGFSCDSRLWGQSYVSY